MDENEVSVARGVPFSGGVSQHLGAAAPGRGTVFALYAWAGNASRDNTPVTPRLRWERGVNNRGRVHGLGHRRRAGGGPAPGRHGRHRSGGDHHHDRADGRERQAAIAERAAGRLQQDATCLGGQVTRHGHRTAERAARGLECFRREP